MPQISQTISVWYPNCFDSLGVYFHICSYMFVGQTSPTTKVAEWFTSKLLKVSFNSLEIGVESQNKQTKKKQVISYNVLFFDQIEKMYKSQLLFYQKDN